HLGTVVAEFSFDQLKKNLAAFARQRRADAVAAVYQGPRPAENPRITEAAPADGYAVGTRFMQEAQGVLRLPHAAATQNRYPHRAPDPAHHGPVGPADIGLGHA